MKRSVRLVLIALLCAISVAEADTSGVEAPAPAASVPSTARAAVEAYLALWTSDAGCDEASLFSDDVALRYAHSNPELHAEVQGRSSAVTQIRALARLGNDWRFRDLRLFPTLRDDVYFTQYTASGTSAADGTQIEQNVVLAVELDGRKVVRLVEFANPAIVLASGTQRRFAASR